MHYNNLYVNIYSNSALNKKTYSLTSNVYETISPPVEYILQSNIKEGKTYAIQKGSPGYKVRVTRNTYIDNSLYSQETISDDYYEPVSEIITTGTNKSK
ncbi:MAG TPA: G5 domain-containing protein [Clostridiaceae bacterium]